MRKLRAELRAIGDDEELQPGDVFYVKRFNGSEDEKVLATLVDTREVSDHEIQMNRDEKKEKNLHNPGVRQVELNEDENGPSNQFQPRRMHTLYYLHYVGLDRRLDDWVERERFLGYAPPDVAIAPADVQATLNGYRLTTIKVSPKLTIAMVVAMDSSLGTMTRSQRRANEEFNHVQRSFEEMDAYTAMLEREHEERTKVKNVEKVQYGDYLMGAWYFAPFSHNLRCDVLHMCRFCLLYTPDAKKMQHHSAHGCKLKNPPGEEVYRDKKNQITVYEVDGKHNKTYCQCLCLLSKLFMDHKTLYYDVETFLFYVLCETGNDGDYVVGHFSKEKHSDNNLACIMVLPPFQRKGYGKLLIQLSYAISQKEDWIGTPEKPLSDLGKVSYRSYWLWKVVTVMDKMKQEDMTVAEISEQAGISQEDLVSTLQSLQFLRYFKIKHTFGVWLHSGEYAVRFSLTRRLAEHCRENKLARPPTIMLDSNAVKYRVKHRQPDFECEECRPLIRKRAKREEMYRTRSCN